MLGDRNTNHQRRWGRDNPVRRIPAVVSLPVIALATAVGPVSPASADHGCLPPGEGVICPTITATPNPVSVNDLFTLTSTTSNPAPNTLYDIFFGRLVPGHAPFGGRHRRRRGCVELFPRFVATVSPAAPATLTPTGSVSFEVRGQTVCTAALDASGEASCQVPRIFLANSDTAVYSGSSVYSPGSETGSLVPTLPLG
jgi:hypothetical protein